MENSNTKRQSVIPKGNLGDSKRTPFAFGIKALKRTLREAGMPKKELNEAVRLYKEKVYTEVAKVKADMEKEFEKKSIKTVIEESRLSETKTAVKEGKVN
jgi:hypothetical protein